MVKLFTYFFSSRSLLLTIKQFNHLAICLGNISILKRSIILVLLFLVQSLVSGQNNIESITEHEASRILNFLANDSLKGRGNGRPELLRAGIFIGDEFRRYGLKPLFGNAGYFMPFRPFGGSKKIVSDKLVWNGKELLTDQFIYYHPQPGNYAPEKLSDFTVIKIDSFFSKDILDRYDHIKTDLLLWSDRPQPDKENYFPPQVKLSPTQPERNVLLVCASSPPQSVLLSGVTNYYNNAGYNVAGVLPGKSKPEEIILFSAHYDHEGVFIRGKKKDSIMNGANDNASGTAALLMLANYFAQHNDNERTIMFCAFSGEELGLLGSKYFVDYVKPETIAAGINIEMIGIAQYGKNNFFITGYHQSTLPSILEKQLSPTPVKVISGPPEEKDLFKRSDNFPFVEKGVPAHSIMSSDDDDKCYHRPCDEIKRIDLHHMTTIIMAIAKASETLISGKDTPTRIVGSSE